MGLDFMAQRIGSLQRERAARAAADARFLGECGVDPVERLQRWDAWLRRVLRESLRWPEDGVRADRLVGQCAAEVTGMVQALRGRGWLLDGEALAGHVRACLAPIAEAQATGKVGDFWPYFRASVGRYVGANAEEIQAQARSGGTDEGTMSVGAVMAAMGIGRGRTAKGESLTELISRRATEVREAKSLRAQQAAKRRAAKEADGQGRLF